MKNLGQYNEKLSVPRKQDVDAFEARVKTNEDNIAMAESDIEGLDTDVGALKTEVSSVKTALNSKQDTITGAASTIVEQNLDKGLILVSDSNGKVGTSPTGKLAPAYVQGLDGSTRRTYYAEFNGTNTVLRTNSNGVLASTFELTPDTVQLSSFTSKDYYVGIKGVSDGTSDHDAVNVRQLNEVKNSIPDVSKISTINVYIATIAGETTKLAENVYVFNGFGNFDDSPPSNLNNIISVNFPYIGDRASSITSAQITSLSGKKITVRFLTTTVYNPVAPFSLYVYAYS